jgi:hypothetical protein
MQILQNEDKCSGSPVYIKLDVLANQIFSSRAEKKNYPHVEKLLILPSASSASSAVKQGEDFSADDKKNLASAKDNFASALEPVQGKDSDATDDADAKTDVFTLSENDDDEILDEF